MSEAGWLDIATAPRDGTVVIVYRPNAVPHNLVGADWVTKSGEWWDSRTNEQPSHWQPLPKPPRASRSVKP